MKKKENLVHLQKKCCQVFKCGTCNKKVAGHIAVYRGGEQHHPWCAK